MGCAYGFLLAGFLWIVIFLGAALIVNLIARST